MKFYILATIILFSQVYADNNSGRMTDGRAFRIDNEGSRVVDQLAELEVRNKELKSKVNTLQDDLFQRENLIQSLRAGVAAPDQDTLREKNLINQTSTGLPKAKTYNCEKEIEKLKSELARLQTANTDIQVENSELTALRSELAEQRAENQRLSLNIEANNQSNNELRLPAKNSRASLASSSLQDPRANKILSAIQAKIMKRKNILDRFNKSKSGVRINASSLKTKSGLSLDNLRQAVRTGDNSNEIYSKLSQIEDILDDDISTATRLKYKAGNN